MLHLGYRKDDTQKTQKFAIKVQKNNISRRSAIKNEIAIMKKIEENDNIVKLIHEAVECKTLDSPSYRPPIAL